MSDKIYPKGVMIFKPRENAPDFVKGSMVVSLREFTDWVKTQQEHYSEYNGKKQLRFKILDGREGLYLELDTWKAESKNNGRADDFLGQPKAFDLNEDDVPF